MKMNSPKALILDGFYWEWDLEKKGCFPRYSNPAYNDNKEQRSVLLSDPELDNCFFMAMEDNVDMRFNDVQFAIMASASFL